MKNKNILILLLSIMIIIVAYLIFKIYNMQDSSKSKNEIIQEFSKIENQIVEKKVVDSYEIYYSVMNAAQKYILYNSNKDSKAVYALLDKNYIEANKITEKMF